MLYESQEAFNVLETAAKEKERTAFLPCTSKQGTGPSHFGGLPLLAEGEAWPVCRICNNPMPLWIQLAAEEAPAPMQSALDGGLFQWFRCLGHPNIDRLIHVRQTEEEVLCSYYVSQLDTLVSQAGIDLLRRVQNDSRPTLLSEDLREELRQSGASEGNAHFLLNGDCSFLAADDSMSQLVRIIDPPRQARTIAGNEIPTSTFGPFFITLWAEAIDRPQLGDLEVDSYWEYYERLDEPTRRAVGEWNLQMDKLGGWPSWVQDAHEGTCPECDTGTTAFLFQVAVSSLSNIPWGHDSGQVYVVQCPNHPRELRAAAQYS